ncbi:hypothetical protein F5883DRAFT_593080 [Diaporthe sp. PMI_573]|nr:hypothetical protein F5883DRAFT_593080 [Diaporthaceae sp. PMI_573]
MLVSMGGYGAERFRGCETEFGRLGAGDNIPYYNVIYYGNVAQAACGFLLIMLSLAFAAIIQACEDIGFGRRRDSRSY